MTNPTDPKPQEALAAPLEARCPKCGSKNVGRDGGWRVYCNDCSVLIHIDRMPLADFAQFFTVQRRGTDEDAEHKLLDNAGIPSTEPDGMGGSVFLSLKRRIQLLIERSTRPSGDGWTTCEEETAIGKLMESQGLSRAGVLRQSLRTYQLIATGHAQLVTEIWGKKK